MEKYGLTDRHGWGRIYKQTEMEEYGLTDRHGWGRIYKQKWRNTV